MTQTVGRPPGVSPVLSGDSRRGPRQAGPSDSFIYTPTLDRLTLAEVAAIMRESVKDKSYRATPVGVMVGRFIRWFRNEYGATPSSVRDYEQILARMSLALADREFLAVTTEDLREVIDLWAGKEPRTRQKVTSVIRSFWAWAEEQSFVPDSPARKIRRPRVPKRVARLLPAEVDELLFAQVNVPRERVALACLLWLGIRQGELRGIQARDFDMGRRRLTVYGKGQKERVIPLRGPIVAEVAFYLQADLPHVEPARPPEPDDYLMYPVRKLFVGRGPEGEQLRGLRGSPKTMPSPQVVHRWWYRILQRAGLVGRDVTSGLNMHRARHTFATEMRRAAGIEGASQAIGHTELNTTLGIYGHQDDSDLEAAFEKYTEAKWPIVPPEEGP